MIADARASERVYSGACAYRRLAMAIYAAVMLFGICVSAFSESAVAAEVDAVGVTAPTNFADIIERVRPAVVGVRVKAEEREPSDGGQSKSSIPPGSPLDRFLRRFGIRPDNPPSQSGSTVGSGFFLSGDGYIVTNNHVIAGGSAIEVTTQDGKVHSAKVIGTDAQTDLALIKIDTKVDLPFVRLAKTEPRIGEWALPIGNPFGLGGTVTAGIVSARGRDIGEGPYDDFIQIDAPVNDGNSGGPTFNVRGEVIGINTAIYTPSGGSVGIAFDIPAATVGLIVQELREKGRVIRGWIGVEMQPVTPAIADALGLQKSQGALVAQVEANGPAARHGIEAGDVITSVNDRAVKDIRELARIIAGMAPNTEARFGIFQNGQTRVVMVRLGELSGGRTAKSVDITENETLGLTFASASTVSAGCEKGVVVMDISPERAAADTGLLVGDIILSVGGKAVDTPADVGRIVDDARARSKPAIMLRLRRGATFAFVAISIS